MIIRILLSAFLYLFIGETTYADITPTLSTPTQTISSEANCPKPSHIQFSVFTRDDCVNCIRLKRFLDTTFSSGSHIGVKYYSLENPDNRKLFDTFTTNYHLNKVTPILLVGTTIIEGFGDAQTTGKTITELANSMTGSSFFEKATPDCHVYEIKAKGCEAQEGAPICANENTSLVVNIPFIGVRDLKDYSLPALSVILGFVDGFNPCAMWVLVMFLSILGRSGSRRKMLEIAGTFILAETIMYFGILNAWFTTWDFIQLDNIVTPLIGLLSVGAGCFFIYEFFTNKDGECTVTSFDQKKRLHDQIQNIVNRPLSVGVFLATIMVAFSVNIIEFACSIGIPQAFTKLLDMSSLHWMMKEWYILLYTFFYMIDDFIVFGVAIYGFEHMHIMSRYTRYCLMIGGILMLILGYFFLFDPAFLKLLIA